MKLDYQKLLAENEELRIRLEEAEEALSAIGSGAVDALVVSSGEGEKIFTLEGADQPYRVLVETMSEGAATLSPDSTVLFCNSRLADLLRTSLGRVLGKPLLSHIAPGDASEFLALLESSLSEHCRLGESFRTELSMLAETGESVPVQLSCCSIDLAGNRGISVIITDLSEQKRNEEIVAAGKLASSILEQAGEAIIVCDETGRVTRASRQAHALFGGNPMFRPFDELGLLEESVSGDRFSIAAPLGGQFYLGVDFIFRRPGRQFYLLLNARPLLHQQKILGCVVSMTDITERKQAEQALQAGKDRLEAALGIARLGVWEYDVAASVAHFDERCRDVFGLSEERPLTYEEIFALIHPADRARVEEAVNSALDPRGTGLYETEYRIVRTDGRLRWVAVRGHAIRSGEGADQFVGTLMDITERQEAEQALRESENRFRTLADNMSQFAWITDGTGWCSWFNKRWHDYTGTTLEEMQGFGWRKAIDPDHLERVLDRFSRSVEKGDVWEDIFPLRGKDGNYRWFLSRAVPIREEDGGIVRWFGTNTDITEQRRAEEELREARTAADEANRAKSEFLANMSHEIRTPMTVFMAAIEHLMQIDRHPERRHLLGMADQSAKRLRSLIDDILDFSRIEARRVELEEEPFDLPGCLREAVGMFALPAREKNLRIELDLGPDIPRLVAGDPNRLGQVLINLIGNAVKFTPKGEVRVMVQPRGDDLLEFAVADTGIGIPEEKRDLLFQSFSQVDASFTRGFGGTGLGLAISRGLIELMGGEISVQSREGEGSVFTFALPLKSIGKEMTATAEAPAESAKESFACRILLAEDEPMIREMISMMLARRGWQAETAESGRHALEKWEGGDFDLILMDLQMPEMNGLEATQAIRRKEAEGARRTCIIGLTAHARREIHEECLASGMDDVLSKPVQMEDLFGAIDSCI